MSTIDLNSYISEPFKNTVKVEFPLLTKDYVSGGRITFRGYNFPIHIDTSVRQGIDSTYNLHKQHTPAWEATHTVSRNQINQIFVLNMPALEAGKEMGVTIEYLSPNGQLVPEMFLNNFTYRSELLRPVGVEIGNGDPLLELHEISANNKVKVTVELPKSVDEGQTVVVKSNTEEFSKEHIVTEEDKELGYVVFEFAAPPENEKMTAEAYLIDKLGNDSARDIGEATRNSLDEPELTLNAIAGDDLISAAEAKDDIEISGFASGNFKAGDKVIVEISADHIIETTVDENGQFAVQVPASVLINDADKHIVADLLDSKGEAIASAERTYKLSPVSPKLSIDLDVIAEDGVFSVAEAAQSHTIKGTVSGEFNAGDKVVVSFDDNIIYTRTVDANGKFEVTDVPASYFLNDADKTIKAVVTTVNALGAKGYAETTETFTFSTEAPNAQTTQLVIENITEDNIINAAEAKGTVSIKGQAIGQFKEGDQVRIFLDDNTYYTRTVDAEGKFSVSSVPASSLVADSDHKITAVLTATNVLGNKGTITAEKEYAVDTVAPNAETTHIALNNVTADNLINGAENKGNITLSGQVTGEFNAGDRVRIYLDDNTYYTRTVDANGHFAADVEASRLVADADRTFKAVLTTTDAAGNTGTIEATKDYNVDTTVEAKVDLYVSNDNFVSVKEARGKVNVYGKVTGEFNEGDQVRIFLDKKTYFTRKVDANGNFNAQIDGKYLVKDADKIASAVLTTTDAAGNTAEISTQTQYAVEKSKVGEVISLRALNGDLGLYYGQSISGSNKGSKDVSQTKAKGHDTYTTTDLNDQVLIGYTQGGSKFNPNQAGSFSNFADANRGSAGKATDGNLSISTLDVGQGDDLVRIRGDQNQQTRVYLGEGNDRIEVGLKVTSAVSTQSAFNTKNSAIAAIFGEAGDDRIDIGGSVHNSFISGGSGSDTINIGFGAKGGGSLVGSTIIDLGSGRPMPAIYLKNYQDGANHSLGNDNNVDSHADVNKLNISANVDPYATILGGNGKDIVTIGGRFNGKMSLGDNNDVVTFAGGTGTIDGGRGNDTVIITGKNHKLNLSQFVSVETIDISGQGSNTLLVNSRSERQAGTTVFVKGNADDKVDLGNVGRNLKETGASKGIWAKSGTMYKDGVMYQGYEFNHQDDSVIYIQQGVQVL